MQQYQTETDLDFFQMLVLHTRQGFYADPIYGGNQNHGGWKAVGILFLQLTMARLAQEFARAPVNE